MAEHAQVRLGYAHALLDFDGRVLEVFAHDGSKRVPLSDLSFGRGEPERRKGRVMLTFSAFGGLQSSLVVEADEVDAVDAFLAELEAAGATRE